MPEKFFESLIFHRKRILIAVAVAAVIAIGWRCLRAPDAPAAAVAQRDMVYKIVASGRVLPPHYVNIGAVVTGKVVERLVEEGFRVKAGDVLLRLDDAEAKAAFAQARAGVAVAQNRLEQVRRVTSPVAERSFREAEAAYTQARKDYERAQKLLAEGGLSQSEMDSVAKSYEVAKNRYESSELQSKDAQPAGNEYRAAAATLAQAKANEDAAAARLANLTITAPSDGLIIARHAEPGDVVTPGETLLELAVDGETLLVAQPDEKNLAYLSIGQKAEASADAFPDKRFPAEIIYIAPAVDPQRGTVEIKLRVAEPPAYLRPEMTISVNIEATRKDGALILPSEAVHDASTGSPWVLVVRGGRARVQKVRIGLPGDGFVEIAEGLQKGDIAILPGAIKDGDRAHPVFAD